jgi:hypothetical protein
MYKNYSTERWDNRKLKTRLNLLGVVDFEDFNDESSSEEEIT